jgi:hypothetical protein
MEAFTQASLAGHVHFTAAVLPLLPPQAGSKGLEIYLVTYLVT